MVVLVALVWSSLRPELAARHSRRSHPWSSPTHTTPCSHQPATTTPITATFYYYHLTGLGVCPNICSLPNTSSPRSLFHRTDTHCRQKKALSIRKWPLEWRVEERKRIWKDSPYSFSCFYLSMSLHVLWAAFFFLPLPWYSG